jgi:hypothetical protein
VEARLVDSGADRRASRWLAATAILVLAVLLLPLVGYAIGRNLDDGVLALPPEERAAGEAALRFASLMIDNPIERSYTLRLRVDSISTAPCPSIEPALAGRRVIVRAHTFFGVPMGSIIICGDASRGA